MNEILAKGKLLKDAANKMAELTTQEKNEALIAIADILEENSEEILSINNIDVCTAKESGTSDALIDRLTLTKERISEITEAVRKLAAFNDPIGEIIESWTAENGIFISKVRVPIGAVGMIYEARPNVTVDAATIALKTGNAIMLRGSSSTLKSNICITELMKKALENTKIPANAIQLIEDPSYDSVNQMLHLRGYLDVIIPRGGASLIKTVTENSSVPVIETGVGNCHVYIDESADKDMAISLAVNSKTQRPSVCNAAETLLVHKTWADSYLAGLISELSNKGVSFAGCPEICQRFEHIRPAEESDWSKEYLDLAVAIKIVDNVDDAIKHIAKYGSMHTETIISEDEKSVKRFQLLVDAAVVNHNVSSRMTDGGIFGFGAEIGISTQKLHARGPMGLRELTSYKYIVSGHGEIR